MSVDVVDLLEAPVIREFEEAFSEYLRRIGLAHIQHVDSRDLRQRAGMRIQEIVFGK